MRNRTLINDLSVPLIKDVAKQQYKKFRSCLAQYNIPLILNFVSRSLLGDSLRGLK